MTLSTGIGRLGPAVAHAPLRVRGLIAFGAGMLLALAMPPAGLVFLVALCFPLLIWCLAGEDSVGQAALMGWLFTFGFHCAGLYWVGVSFTYLPGGPTWPVPFAVAGAAAGLALFGAAACALWRLLVNGFPSLEDRPLSVAILFALIWALGEWLRGHVLTGFPWNLAGYGWSDSTAMLQVTALIGIYGLGLITLVAGCLPAALPAALGRTCCAIAGAGLVLAGLYLWGGDRLSRAPEPDEDGPLVRLVQPVIAQDVKWRSDLLRDHFELYSSLTTGPGWQAVRIVIWGETAVPYLLEEEPIARQALATVTPPGGYLITGSRRREPGSDGPVSFYNSLMVIDPRGDIVGQYDKHHLVPFGEYIPLQDWLPFASLAGAQYAAGPGPVHLAPPGIPPFSPLICYEVIFPGAVTAPGTRPEWLLNLTNDGWYGRTAGPHQHFAIARVRAIETGLPLIRVAASGISAVVDGHGRIVARTGLHERAVLDVPLPSALPDTTAYANWGDRPFWLALLLGLILVAVLGIRRTSPSPNRTR